MTPRNFFHSFPRPKKGESAEATLERGLQILEFMSTAGLVLAPEIVEWDVGVLTRGAEELRVLQRRACFTELSESELGAHATTFGPIALAFDISKLRAAGATPVIYVPQGVSDSPLSLISTFCVRGAYHTQHVLKQLQGLVEMSDPANVARQFDKPVATDYSLNLQNSDGSGKIVTEYSVPAAHVSAVLKHVGFNNIPFDHSTGVLNIFLNMFYPTDNQHTGDLLGYYRQREWRLIAGDVNINGRPMGRPLTEAEIENLQGIDRDFWTRELETKGGRFPRSSLALMYEPTSDWKLFDVLEAVYAPQESHDKVRKIVGDRIAVR